MNLPNAWNINDISDVLNVDSDGLILECTGESGPTTIRMNYPIYPKCGIFYFEIRINKGTNGLIGIGFCTKTVDTNIYLDGTMNPGTVFYTKNGVNLGIAFRDLEDVIYPCVGLQSQNCSVEVIFSRKKFKYTAITDDDIANELLRKKWLETLDFPNNKAINQQQYNLLDSIFDPNNVHLLEYQGKINFIMVKEVIRERKLKSEEQDLRVLGLRIQLEEMLMEQEGLAELSGAQLKEIWKRKKQEEIDEVQKKLQSLENGM
ncbi:SPRY-domain-containing protein [Gigaspora margarita]|uniref:SPRY-domain-containing protein n=1 Tax=Gigaspora margarita TaxID=4874 RepID=A0A8H4AR27_GIGMA|nr:SPRY-domain-containing protein [Gigaspora margarita]